MKRRVILKHSFSSTKFWSPKWSECTNIRRSWKVVVRRGKKSADDKWLKVWLMFVISSLLCLTSSTKLCVRAFHSIAIIEEIQGYNWCKLIVDRLIKEIADFKNGERKFLSGCLFFLTVCMLNFSHILLFPVFFLQDLTICISPPANIIPGFTWHWWHCQPRFGSKSCCLDREACDQSLHHG